MDRKRALGLVIAAVLGTTGGTAVAMQYDDNPGAQPSTQPGSHSGTNPTNSPVPTATSSPSDAPTPQNAVSGRDDSTYEPLLYAEKGAIHDGRRRIAAPDIKDPSSVGRAKGGYLVADYVPNRELIELAFVAERGGRSRSIIQGSFGWDVNQTGDRIVGLDPLGQVTIWDLRGNTTTWEHEGEGLAMPSFVGDEVMISFQSSEESGTYRWNPETNTTTADLRGDGYSLPAIDEFGTSPGGSYYIGATTSPNGSDSDPACLTLGNTWLKKNPVNWRTCDWRTFGSQSFSPDGTRLIAYPKDPQGFSVESFGIIDATDGPGNLVARFDAPDGAIEAVWGDNEHLYVYGANDTDPELRSGTFIDRCDLSGKCHRVAESKTRLGMGSIS